MNRSGRRVEHAPLAGELGATSPPARTPFKKVKAKPGAGVGLCRRERDRAVAISIALQLLIVA